MGLPISVLVGMDPFWELRAKCKELDRLDAEAMFFIGRGQTTKRAREYCYNCPVARECLTSAIVNNEQGIWAGTSEKERRDMRHFVNSLEEQFLKRESVDVDSLFNVSRPEEEKPEDYGATVLELFGPTEDELAEEEPPDPI